MITILATTLSFWAIYEVVTLAADMTRNLLGLKN